jgi:hypothetical protein
VVERGAAWAFARYGFRAAAMRDLVAPAAGAASANDAAASASSLPFKSLVGLIRRPCGGGTAAAAPAVAAVAAASALAGPPAPPAGRSVEEDEDADSLPAATLLLFIHLLSSMDADSLPAATLAAMREAAEATAA